MLPTVHIIGNCQARQLASVLKQKAPEIIIHTHSLDHPSLRDEHLLAGARDNMRSSDLYIVQPSKVPHLNEIDLRNSFGSNVFVVPRVYFNGTMPDMCYVGRFGSRIGVIGDYNSVVVLEAYKAGLSPADAKSLFNAASFEKLGLFSIWERSLEEMQDREQAVDLKISSWLDENAKRSNILHSHNHPRVNVASYIIDQFCLRYGIKTVEVLDLFDTMYIEPWVPMYDFVAEYFKLPYRSNQYFKYNVNEIFYFNEFVDLSYKLYSQTPTEELVVNSPGFTIETIKRFSWFI